MSSVEICAYGAPVLRKKAVHVKQFDKRLQEQVDRMLQVMYTAKGVGLAAPQVGKTQQVVVIDLQMEPNNEMATLDGKLIPLQLVQPLVLVNPSFDPVDDVLMSGGEGCLSIPNVHGHVHRYLKIFVKYQDIEGIPHELTCERLLARCIQHEVDHLNGILFIDRISKTERKENTATLKALKARGGIVTYENPLSN
ncbi:MAG: peptide deformylase [Puniceicoccales bacterium]|jgi:peptide deformylase|nr:peptide deformylase [Puniceicoccales bacterium]